MTRYESHQSRINQPASLIYSKLSNFNNLKSMLPSDVKNWQSTEDTCSFEINMIGFISMKMLEKKEFSLIKIVPDSNTKYDFKFWIQLKQISEFDTRMKFTLDITLNPMLKMAFGSKLKDFMNTLSDRVAEGFNQIN
ncbi:MAG: hypothetical protein HN704_07980 [Bacteroidetes bacterium]|jgi:hypothetical protein|nr:hypothetical protein [Bacteroidota bacterium]MBT6684980.1 hypothetical protein [Bacteroidota bacterium]MBT7143058.1 hypothetical protein [Bacteroidota bacterium]MBT7491529.1 hypothetical protein [Bacteroidota bacterium]